MDVSLTGVPSENTIIPMNRPYLLNLDPCVYQIHSEDPYSMCNNEQLGSITLFITELLSNIYNGDREHPISRTVNILSQIQLFLISYNCSTGFKYDSVFIKRTVIHSNRNGCVFFKKCSVIALEFHSGSSTDSS